VVITLNLPYPPSINSYWRANGHRRFISKEGRKFREDVVAYLLENQIPNLGTIPLQVTIALRPRDKRKTDIDNRIKAVLDALESFVFEDDCQVEKLVVFRAEPIKGGKCLVVIEPHQPKGELAPC
jgi:crossover junction endodeoxyribonuclease RusA